MACACKVNQELSFLQKKYGVGGPKNKKTDISYRAKKLFMNAITIPITLLLTPIMFFSIIFNKKGVIKLDKVFGLKSHERYQPNI